jgi:class 3 adenylate cyclase
VQRALDAGNIRAVARAFADIDGDFVDAPVIGAIVDVGTALVRAIGRANVAQYDAIFRGITHPRAICSLLIAATSLENRDVMTIVHEIGARNYDRAIDTAGYNGYVDTVRFLIELSGRTADIEHVAEIAREMHDESLAELAREYGAT